MSIEECRRIILDNFRSIKLEKDYAKFQLLLFQILDLISQYEKLIELQEEIQSKHFQLIKNMEDQRMLEGFDYVALHNKRCDELASWRNELDILTEYKNHISNILGQIEDGTAEQSLMDEEKEFLK